MPSYDAALDAPTDERSRPEQDSAVPDRPIPLMVRIRIGFVRGFLIAYMRSFGLSGLYRLGRFFGTLEYFCDYNRRRRVRRKLTSLFGDELTGVQRKKIAWKYFMRIRCDKMFYTIMDRIPRGKLLNRIKIKGRHIPDDALARGKGLYVALCHYGSHHVAGLMIALLGYKIAGVRDPKESHVRRYIYQKYRETWPEVAAMKLVFTNTFPRVLYRHLQQNGIVASLLDVDPSRAEQMTTHPVQFFGQTQNFLTGPVQMAARCGATILQGFVVSRKNFYYQLIPTQPLIDPAVASAMSEKEMLAFVMQRYADGVEQFVREHPDHVMNI